MSELRNRQKGSDRQSVKFIIAIATVLAIGAGSAVAVMSWRNPFALASDAETSARALTYVSTPAADAVEALFGALPGSWAPVSEPVSAVADPFSCNIGGAQPVVSTGQEFTTDAGPVQLIVTAFPAGLGADAVAEIRSTAPDCVDDGGNSAAVTEVEDDAHESLVVLLFRGGTEGRVLVVRAGDVVVFALGVNPSAVAAEVGAALDSAVSSSCINTLSTAADASRNPLIGADYEPFTVGTVVEVDAPTLPRAPANATFTVGSLPAPVLALPEVTPAPTPDYPVFPPMPAMKALPVFAVEPPVLPPLSREARQLREDVDGPGCGWAFTGAVAPVFRNADDENAAAVAQVREELDEGVVDWKADVLAFWGSREADVAAAADYAAWASEVTSVNRAWAVIAAQWAAYESAYARWLAEVKRAAKFDADQLAAQSQYDREIRACSEPQPEPTPVPTPVPSASPSQPPMSVEECESAVVRPPILDQKRPKVGVEPAKPADPRP